MLESILKSGGYPRIRYARHWIFQEVTGRLYYYNENYALELIDSSVVGDDGRIALEFTHASDYVIVIGDTVSSPVDNRWWVIPMAVFVATGVVGGIVCLKRNSKRKND